MAETVLVTGGTGYVAGWCIVDLLQRGYVVRTTLRSAKKEAGLRAAIAAAAGPTDNLTFVLADLTSDDGWDAAMSGCDYVLHVASPLGATALNADRDALVAPARDGTLRVLHFATKAGVKRVVMTSAAATARAPQGSDAVANETFWSDPDDKQFDAYRRSKILAEKAAWDFMEKNPSATSLTTILPGAVFGPVLTKGNVGSVTIIKQMLTGKPPRIPRLGFWIVDVRDLAALHVKAMTAPTAAGERFLATGDFMWMKDIAVVLKAHFGKRAPKIPSKTMPDFVVRFLARFMPQLRQLVPILGHKNPVTSHKARSMLGFSPRPATQTITDCAETLI